MRIRDRSATHPRLRDERQILMADLSRTNHVTFHNDATSCYDRIIIALANLVARRFGLPEEICRLHGVTLEQMRYHISTEFGISKESYKHLNEPPVYGTGQGSCASPSVWLQICSVLFDCHDQQSYGANYSSPDGTIKFKASMTGLKWFHNSNVSSRIQFEEAYPASEPALRATRS